MDLSKYLFLVCILVGNVSSESSVNSTVKEQCPNVKTSLVSVRKRRHLAFPPGSACSKPSFQLHISRNDFSSLICPSHIMMWPIDSETFHETGPFHEMVESFHEVVKSTIRPPHIHILFVVTTSVVKTFMTHAPSGWYVVVEAELVYMLPDHTIISSHLRRKLHHRQKKEIWETLESMFQQRNMNGRACVIRTICEARQSLAPKGKSLVHDILRAMFTAPLHERDFIEEMGMTYTELLDPDFCEKANDCPLSVLGVILDLNRQR